MANFPYPKKLRSISAADPSSPGAGTASAQALDEAHQGPGNGRLDQRRLVPVFGEGLDDRETDSKTPPKKRKTLSRRAFLKDMSIR